MWRARMDSPTTLRACTTLGKLSPRQGLHSADSASPFSEIETLLTSTGLRNPRAHSTCGEPGWTRLQRFAPAPRSANSAHGKAFTPQTALPLSAKLKHSSRPPGCEIHARIPHVASQDGLAYNASRLHHARQTQPTARPSLRRQRF